MLFRTVMCFELSVRQHLEEKMSSLSEACLYNWDVERMVMWLREVSLNLAGRHFQEHGLEIINDLSICWPLQLVQATGR